MVQDFVHPQYVNRWYEPLVYVLVGHECWLNHGTVPPSRARNGFGTMGSCMDHSAFHWLDGDEQIYIGPILIENQVESRQWWCGAVKVDLGKQRGRLNHGERAPSTFSQVCIIHKPEISCVPKAKLHPKLSYSPGITISLQTEVNQ